MSDNPPQPESDTPKNDAANVVTIFTVIVTIVVAAIVLLALIGPAFGTVYSSIGPAI